MNYFISGLPRSGSTVLYNILKQNPNLSNLTKERKWGTDKSIPDLLKMNKPKILVTYRPILEVLASFVQLATEHPQTNFIDDLMNKEQFPALYYRPMNDARCDWLMRPHGAIDMSMLVFKNMAIFPEWFKLITYDDLCLKPEEVIKEVYDFFELNPFDHNLNSIKQTLDIEDNQEYGIPNLHTIKPSVQKSSTNPDLILSNYAIQKYQHTMDIFTQGWL